MSEDAIDGVAIPKIEKVIQDIARERGIDFSRVTIREINILGAQLRKRLGIDFIAMDIGVPGLPTPNVILEAQIAAITGQACSQYTSFDGLPDPKEAGAYFLKQYLGIEVDSVNVIPTVGGMLSCKENIGIVGRLNPEKDTVLLLAPGFSVNELQARNLGVKTKWVDIHGKYGDDLVNLVEAELGSGNIAGMLWSSPNNPTWRVLSERELKGIGASLTKHDAIGMEDLAYFGLDSRMKDRRIPGQAPYFPTIANYTNNWVLILSGSKIFNYAGERIGATVLSDHVAGITSEHLQQFYNRRRYWDAIVQGGLYSTVASVSQSAQRAFAAGLRAAADPDHPFNYFEYDKPYEDRARAVRERFLSNGFSMPYDKDDFGEIGFGYYFTATHPGFKKGSELALEMLKYGMTAVPLVGFGGNRHEGVRICVSLVTEDKLDKLSRRLEMFNSAYNK